MKNSHCGFFLVNCGLDGDSTLDAFLVFIFDELDVIPREIQDVFHIRIQADGRELVRCSGDLLLHLIDMIQVYMCIAKEMVEATRLSTSYMCHHTEQKWVLCCVVRDTQECITTTLIHIQVEHSWFIRKELVEGRAWWQKSFFLVSRTPQVDNNSAIFRIVLDQFNSIHELVFSLDDYMRDFFHTCDESFAQVFTQVIKVDLFMSSELVSVSTTKFTPFLTENIVFQDDDFKSLFGFFPIITVLRFFGIFPFVLDELGLACGFEPILKRPFSPDMVVLFDQPADVCVTIELPHQFLKNWFQTHEFRGQ